MDLLERRGLVAMSMTGMECAAAVGTLTRQLDTHANSRLRQHLAGPVAVLLAAAGIPADAELQTALTEWVANGSTVRSLDSGTSRLRRSRAFQRLHPEQIELLDKALTEPKHREQLMSPLLLRQRRRNVGSQVRSIMRVLTPHWLMEEMRSNSPEEIGVMLQHATWLNERVLESADDIEMWQREVLDFYTRLSKQAAPIWSDSRTTNMRTPSSGTTRTYRASWTQFWDELPLVTFLVDFAQHGKAQADMLPLFAQLESSTESIDLRSTEPMHLHLSRHDLVNGWDVWSPSATALMSQRYTTPSRPERRASSPAVASGPLPDDADDSTQFATLAHAFVTNLASAPATAANTSNTDAGAMVTVVLVPDGRTADAATIEVPAGVDAAERLQNHIIKILKIESEARAWDSKVSTEAGGEKLTIQRSGLSPADAVNTVLRMLAAIDDLA